MFLAVVAATLVGALAAWTAEVGSLVASVGVFVFVVAGWVVALCLHEFAHAWFGYRAGDHSVPATGYLTLNPIRYGHPLLTLVLPLLVLLAGGIGLPGGTVNLCRHRFRSRGWASTVSAAGPAVNLVTAAVLIGALRLPHDPAAHQAFWSAVAFLGYLQLSVAVLNLMPVPGLDAWGIWEPFLPTSVQERAAKVKPFGFLLLFVLLGATAAGPLLFAAVFELADLAGLSATLWQTGAALFQFWRH